MWRTGVVYDFFSSSPNETMSTVDTDNFEALSQSSSSTLSKKNFSILLTQIMVFTIYKKYVQWIINHLLKILEFTGDSVKTWSTLVRLTSWSEHAVIPGCTNGLVKISSLQLRGIRFLMHFLLFKFSLTLGDNCSQEIVALGFEKPALIMVTGLYKIKIL